MLVIRNGGEICICLDCSNWNVKVESSHLDLTLILAAKRNITTAFCHLKTSDKDLDL